MPCGETERCRSAHILGKVPVRGLWTHAAPAGCRVNTRERCIWKACSEREARYSRGVSRSTGPGDRSVRVYTHPEARQNFASLLEIAQRDGAVRIRRKDGRAFVLQPGSSAVSPLDVEGVDIGVTSAETVAMIREGRGRYG